MQNEERTAAIQRNEDREANLLALWNENQGMIQSIVKHYSGVAEMDDLMQQAYIGLHIAAINYNPAAGAKFITYATLCIQRAVQRFVDANTGAARVPILRRRELWRYRASVQELEQELNHKPTRAEIQGFLGVPMEQQAEYDMLSALLLPDSTETPIPETDGVTLGDTIQDPTDRYSELADMEETDELRRVFWEAVDALPDSLSEIIRERCNKGGSLPEIGARIGINANEATKRNRKAVEMLRASRPLNRMRRALYNEGLHGCGLVRFQQTWTSSTERVALRFCGT